MGILISIVSTCGSAWRRRAQGAPARDVGPPFICPDVLLAHLIAGGCVHRRRRPAHRRGVRFSRDRRGALHAARALLPFQSKADDAARRVGSFDRPFLRRDLRDAELSRAALAPRIAVPLDDARVRGVHRRVRRHSLHGNLDAASAASAILARRLGEGGDGRRIGHHRGRAPAARSEDSRGGGTDRKSTRLNSSHTMISYAVFCLKKKKIFIACNNTALLHKRNRNPYWTLDSQSNTANAPTTLPV